MFIWRDMWKGKPPRTPQIAARRRRFFLAVHCLPPKGWYCSAVEDFGQVSVQCHVCGTPIEYVCYIGRDVENADGVIERVELEIGKECLKDVTQGDEDVDRWFNQQKARAKRRRKWLDAKWWSMSRYGNAVRQHGRRKVWVGRHRGAFNWGVETTRRVNYGPGGYQDAEAAALAVFDYLDPPAPFQMPAEATMEWLRDRRDAFLSMEHKCAEFQYLIAASAPTSAADSRENSEPQNQNQLAK